MIKPRYIDSVCRPFCSFYREGKKENEACGGVLFLDRRFSLEQVAELVRTVKPQETVGRDRDHILKERLCDPCPFAVEDCDFRAGKTSPPCGGYVLVALLLKAEKIIYEER